MALETGEEIGKEKGLKEGEEIGVKKGEKIGKEEGLKEGEEIGVKKVAEAMKQKGINLQTIKEICGLSIK